MNSASDIGAVSLIICLFVIETFTVCCYNAMVFLFF